MKTVNFVIINGCGASGKDTFVEYCDDICKSLNPAVIVTNYSTIESSKRIFAMIADEIPQLRVEIANKSHAYRNALSAVKDYLDMYYQADITDLTVKLYSEGILFSDSDHMHDELMFIHCREPFKIKRLVEFLTTLPNMINDPEVKINVNTLLIDGLTDPSQFSNHADRDVRNYEYDYTITNKGTLDELKASAEDFIKSLTCCQK